MRIIVISAHAAQRSALQQLLSDGGHQVMAAATRPDGLALATTLGADVVVADAQLPWLDGAALMRELSTLGMRPHVILLCSRDVGESECGFACLTRPIDLDRLRRHIASRERAEGRVA